MVNGDFVNSIWRFRKFDREAIGFTMVDASSVGRSVGINLLIPYNRYILAFDSKTAQIIVTYLFQVDSYVNALYREEKFIFVAGKAGYLVKLSPV
jgi:hypothetical protein